MYNTCYHEQLDDFQFIPLVKQADITDVPEDTLSDGHTQTLK